MLVLQCSKRRRQKRRRRKRRRSHFHRPGSFNVFTIIQSVSVFLGHDGITLNSEHLSFSISLHPFPSFLPRSYSPSPPFPAAPSLSPRGMSQCTLEWRREVGLALRNSISEEQGLRGALPPPKGCCWPPFAAPPAKKTDVDIQHCDPAGLCWPGAAKPSG